MVKETASKPHAHLDSLRANLKSQPATLRTSGTLVRQVGLVLEARGLNASIGQPCSVERVDGTHVAATVMGFNQDLLMLMASGRLDGVGPGARIIPDPQAQSIPVGEALLSRVVDGYMRALDGGPSLALPETHPLNGYAVNPMSRPRIDTPMDVGVRAINGLLTVGQGQRLGLFSGSGVGKSVLLGMMARAAEADVVVVGLIGERGREVREVIDDVIGAAREKTVVVAEPADRPALARLRAANVATSVAEYFRARGCQVLLIMDALTRVAMAAREVALAVGEPPVTRGYPPSVFAMIPELIERTGKTQSGAITAFYTVLMEQDDETDPIADAARAILDGHIRLSRELAEQAHYPAIDLGGSISRVMDKVVSEDHHRAAGQFRRLWSRYHAQEDMMNMGAYEAGRDPVLDEAIERHEAMEAFLTQTPAVVEDFSNSRDKLFKTLQYE